MNAFRSSAFCGLLICLLLNVVLAEEPPLDFARDIRPILSDKCYTCHGPDAERREAGLRLDDKESLFRAAESGEIPVVPGDPSQSEVARRLTTDDPEQRMPPPDSKKPLAESDRAKIVAWIASGAAYAEHWSFRPLRRPDVPAASRGSSPIDAFVDAALRDHGLTPASEARPETLIRRLSLDLIGLPPTPEEVDAFVDSYARDPKAYELLVDRLLASPHYGERMAMEWLDAARFADTNGYHLDNGRDMTRWRAWVIEAFNQNLPFDQFTIQQLAGDLLPDATDSQRVASGFHRNHMINFEGGAIPEEYQAAYIVDRVNTTGAVWLGLTIGCAQCHDHKYDPISQRDYYQMYAFFNNVPEKGLDGNQGNAAPLLTFPAPEQMAKMRAIDAQLNALRALNVERTNKTKAEEAKRKESLEANEGNDAKNAKSVNSALDAAEIEKAIAAREQERSQLEREIPSTMVMAELPTPRESFVLVRGQYDQHGTKVEALTPASLPPFPADAPRNRLGLARWLVSPEQPLTARVIANRHWQHFFGVGLVPTSEDFGAQGAPPSHPELLDWLACELREPTPEHGLTVAPSAWNVRHLVKVIVMSAAYRRDARVTDEHLRLDPTNRWLARGARHRLAAELIRDQALAASGLLKHRIGGASASPYQPGDLWGELSSRSDSSNWTAQFFVQSHGDDLYRRGMYTFWKRTCPPVQLSTFDAPDRETCVVRRARTNTPLQALIVLNDPTYVEAARHLAARELLDATITPADLVVRVFRRVLARAPSSEETRVLVELAAAQVDHFQAHPELARQLLAVGEASSPSELDSAKLAGWTMVASTILNLDETLTRN